ncbi:MAG: lysozyme inhibitor LprI family protein [Solirubrobacteraceae bacterium]
MIAARLASAQGQRLRLAIVLVALGVGVGISDLTGVAAAASGRAASARLSPPVIRDPITALPCPRHPQTTLALESCEEHRTVRIDHQINRVAASIFARLRSRSARGKFIQAQRAWLGYRRADCVSLSVIYQGGTAAGVLYAGCTSTRSLRRLKDLQAFERVLAHR